MAGNRVSGRNPGSEVAVLLFVLLASAAFGSLGAFGRSTSTAGLAPIPAASGTYFDYIVIIVMENHEICNIITSCGGQGTYETALANANGLAWKDRYCNVNPSLPNYLCLTGGTDFGCAGYDGGPHSNPCTNTAWSSSNIVDRLVAGGVTWKAYMEDMPSNCYGSDSGQYAVRHNPFVYYNSIVGNASRCSRVVPAGSSDGTLLNDLGSTSTASNYMWLTPNVCNDMHDCDVPTGDAYLGGLVPQILSSTVFTNQRAALYVTFDEGYGNPVYTAWAGSVVKSGFQSNVSYDHFSLLATLETNWNLPPLTPNDTGATPMDEFFGSATPDYSLSASPAGVAFVAGQTGTSTISLQPSGGFTGSVSLAAQSSPSGVSTTCVPSTISGTGTSTCTMSSSTPGSYTVTVTGTSGSLTRTATISVSVLSQPPAGPSSTLQEEGEAGDAGWFVSAVNVTLFPYDTIGPAVWAQYRLDAGPWTNYTGPFRLLDGRHTLEYYATDGYGSPPEPHHSATINVDSTPPVLGSIGPAEVFVTSSVKLRWSGSDATSGIESYEVRADGGAFQSVGSSPGATLTLADGSHTIDVRAKDVAGNVAMQTKTVRVDTNIFSPTGPFTGLPTYAIVLVGVLALIAAIVRRRRK